MFVSEAYDRLSYQKMLSILTIIFTLLFTLSCTRRAPQQSSATSVSSSTNTPPVPFIAIEGDPLTIYVAEDASYQVIYRNPDGSQAGQVYSPFAENADAGLFARYNNFVIGPNFDADYRITVANIYDPWIPISQTMVTGSGLDSDPWVVDTEVSHSSSITMTSQTSYVNGDNFFNITWEICLPNPGNISTFLAADFSLVGENNWSGSYESSTGSVGAINIPQNWSESFTPIHPATHFTAAYYKTVWDAIGSQSVPGTGFNDIIATLENAIGAGLQWDLMISGCATIQANWCVGPSTTCPPQTGERTFLPLIHK